MQNSLRDPADVIGEARRWVGTPFRDRGHRAGHGADCVGLLRGVCENLGLVELSREQMIALDTYSRTPNPHHMGEWLNAFLIATPLDRAQPAPDGYVAWVEWREGLPMHLALMATFQRRRTVIHALKSANAVVEHGFTGIWPKRIHSWWKLPGVSYG